MRPRPLVVILFVLLVVLSTGWSARTKAMIGLEDGRVSECAHLLGPGALVTVAVPCPDCPAAAGTRVHVRWIALAVFILICYIVAAATATAVRRLTGGDVPTIRWILTGSTLVVAIGFFTSVAWSRWYWGYFFSRPAAQESTRHFRHVIGLSPVDCHKTANGYRCVVAGDRSIESEIASCSRDDYYCLGGRLAVALRNARLWTRNTAPASPQAIRALETLLGAGFLEPVEGYEGNDELHGVLAVGISTTNESLIALGLAGGQISNDHFPYYEVVASDSRISNRIIRKVVFFWDVAGIENLEWPYAWALLTLIGITVWLPVAIGATLLIDHRRNRVAARHSTAAY